MADKPVINIRYQISWVNWIFFMKYSCSWKSVFFRNLLILWFSKITCWSTQRVIFEFTTVMTSLNINKEDLYHQSVNDILGVYHNLAVWRSQPICRFADTFKFIWRFTVKTLYMGRLQEIISSRVFGFWVFLCKSFKQRQEAKKAFKTSAFKLSCKHLKRSLCLWTGHKTSQRFVRW